MNFIKFDGHVHTLPVCFLRNYYKYTSVPISLYRIRKAVQVMQEKNISFAMTDHDTLEPYRALQSNNFKGKKIVKDSLVKDMGCVLKVGDSYIIAGQEVTSRDGHILAWGIDEVIKPGMSTSDTVDAINSAGGLCVIPHIYSPLGVGEKNLRKAADRIYGIEMSVGLYRPWWNRRILGLADEYKLRVFANNDAHLAGSIGRHGFSKIPAEIFNKNSGKSIIKAMRSMKRPKIEINQRLLRLTAEKPLKIMEIGRYFALEYPLIKS